MRKLNNVLVESKQGANFNARQTKVELLVMNTTVSESEASTQRSLLVSLNSVITFIATLLIAWLLYRFLQVVQVFTKVNRPAGAIVLLNNTILHCRCFEKCFFSGILPCKFSPWDIMTLLASMILW